ncbi:hypothetical protein [Falsiroseomonas sp. CW058]|uniref:hypothetical protein n=1 Tax=Falsiroseomonas sp. CW058 TaxID=3388664 RepID=UPI003D31B1F3
MDEMRAALIALLDAVNVTTKARKRRSGDGPVWLWAGRPIEDLGYADLQAAAIEASAFISTEGESRR